MATITSANAIFNLSVVPLFLAAQRLQGFAADDVFSTRPINSAEVLMGLDGIQSAGYVNVSVEQEIALQADSPSMFIFDTWYNAQVIAQDLYFASGTVTLPGTGSKWAMTKGVLSTYHSIPDSGKTLKPRRFGITWQSVSPALA